LGINHPETGNGYWELEIIYENKEQYDKAESYFKKALITYKQIFGKNHPTTKTIKDILDNLHQ
jgi:tetratricopeptide (TPR) repeat protein